MNVVDTNNNNSTTRIDEEETETDVLVSAVRIYWSKKIGKTQSKEGKGRAVCARGGSCGS